MGKIKICEISGELAGYVLEPNQWPEIVAFSLSSAQVLYEAYEAFYIICSYSAAFFWVSLSTASNAN